MVENPFVEPEDPNNPFADPGEGGVSITTFEDELVAIKPIEVKYGVMTQYGEANPLLADVCVLTGPQTGQEYRQLAIFQRYLKEVQLAPHIGTGKWVRGRVIKDMNRKKKGQDAPWALDTDLSQADKDASLTWWQKRQKKAA